jgi:hypothetical protein
LVISFGQQSQKPGQGQQGGQGQNNDRLLNGKSRRTTWRPFSNSRITFRQRDGTFDSSSRFTPANRRNENGEKGEEENRTSAQAGSRCRWRNSAVRSLFGTSRYESRKESDGH